MGWKGTLRSVNAAIKAAERENKKVQKQRQKEDEIFEAANAVEDWRNYIQELTSIHIDIAEKVDWHSIVDAPKPIIPINITKYREKLAPKLKHFRPRFTDFLHGGTEKRKQKLIEKFKEAKLIDESATKDALSQFSDEIKEWDNDQYMASKVIAGDANALKEVIEESQLANGDDLIGSNIKFKFGNNFIHAMPQIHTQEIIPNFRRKQLASGKLSQSKMPAGEFNELYQDYAASVALKIAGDLFHILPQEEVFVTCFTIMLDKTTGHQKPTPILSVQFVNSTLSSLNLLHIDPSDSLSNFNHVMDFKRTKGFSEIIPLHSIE